MAEKPSINAPGLRWRPRKDRHVPYWMPSPAAVAARYPSGAVNLDSLLGSPADLIARCEFLNAQMEEWLTHRRRPATGFDDTIAAVIDTYQTHEDSPYRKLKPGTLRPYDHYLGKLKHSVGARNVLTVTALDVQRWHRDWTDGGRFIAAGAMAASVLKAALTFCIVAGHRQCRQLRDDISELKLPSPAPRKIVASAAQVVASREAAHALGRPSAALCYALQFETTLRLYDVAGQWYPLDAPVISTVIHRDRKWAGVEWRHVGPDLVLRYKPSKTADTSGAEVALDLSLCPMVLDEIARIPTEQRVGPLVVFEPTGRPYTRSNLTATWRKVREKAGLGSDLWARDLRASAITEARAAGVPTEDASKVAGHTKAKITADVYDRDRLGAHQRLQAARLLKRAGNGPAND